MATWFVLACVSVHAMAWEAMAWEPAAWEPTVDEPPSLEGFWPTEQMIEAFLLRWSDRTADTYELRPDQRARLESQLLDRWRGFLDQNRHELQPLLNEYIGARFAPSPPSADRVSSWAARAMPLFQKLHAGLAETRHELRSILDKRQQATFDAKAAKIDAGMAHVQRKLKRWSVGSFKSGEWWSPPGQRRPEHLGETASGESPPGQRASDQPASGQAAFGESIAANVSHDPSQEQGAWPSRIVEELDAWTRHVALFCDKYGLDRSQRNSADSMLRELLIRVREHIHRNLDEILAVEERIASPAGTNRDKTLNRLQEVYGPIDRMFRELDERLNKLPTPGQRRRVDQ